MFSIHKKIPRDLFYTTESSSQLDVCVQVEDTCLRVQGKKRKKKVLDPQVCLVLLYSCSVGVKSTDAALRLLSLKATANRTVKHDTDAHRANTLLRYIYY